MSTTIINILLFHIPTKQSICIRHRWEGEMGSSQHKSLHQARAFRRVLDVVTSAEISPSHRTQRCSMHFLVRISIWNGKIKLNSEAYWRECEMGWFTIRLVVKANNMSARKANSGNPIWLMVYKLRYRAFLSKLLGKNKDNFRPNVMLQESRPGNILTVIPSPLFRLHLPKTAINLRWHHISLSWRPATYMYQGKRLLQIWPMHVTLSQCRASFCK